MSYKPTIGFDNLAFAAKRSKRALVHRLADTMGQVPSGFHAGLEHPLDLPGAHALLARAHEVDHLKPEVQRQVAILKDRAHADGKRLAAGVALAKADPALTSQPSNVFFGRAAMRADRTLRPQRRLNMGESRFFVVEMQCTQDWMCHG